MSGVDALRSMVTPGVTAEVFEPEDAESLAAVAGALVEDPARRAQLGQTARSWMLEHRDWERLSERYVDLYRSLGAIR